MKSNTFYMPNTLIILKINKRFTQGENKTTDKFIFMPLYILNYSFILSKFVTYQNEIKINDIV